MVSVPLCTAGEEILAGEPGGRKGWSRRQAERAAETPLAIHTIRKGEEIKGGGSEGGARQWQDGCQKQTGKKEKQRNKEKERCGLEKLLINRRIEMEITLFLPVI